MPSVAFFYKDLSLCRILTFSVIDWTNYFSVGAVKRIRQHDWSDSSFPSSGILKTDPLKIFPVNGWLKDNSSLRPVICCWLNGSFRNFQPMAFGSVTHPSSGTLSSVLVVLYHSLIPFCRFTLRLCHFLSLFLRLPSSSLTSSSSITVQTDYFRILSVNS